VETLTTAEAAALLGVNVQKYHRLATKHGITPLMTAPGLRGAKFWTRAAVEMIRRFEAEVAA
jgi:hypothetical protein